MTMPARRASKFCAKKTCSTAPHFFLSLISFEILGMIEPWPECQPEQSWEWCLGVLWTPFGSLWPPRLVPLAVLGHLWGYLWGYLVAIIVNLIRTHETNTLEPAPGKVDAQVPTSYLPYLNKYLREWVQSTTSPQTFKKSPARLHKGSQMTCTWANLA